MIQEFSIILVDVKMGRGCWHRR